MIRRKVCAGVKKTAVGFWFLIDAAMERIHAARMRRAGK